MTIVTLNVKLSRIGWQPAKKNLTQKPELLGSISFCFVQFAELVSMLMMRRVCPGVSVLDKHVRGISL